MKLKIWIALLLIALVGVGAGRRALLLTKPIVSSGSSLNSGLVSYWNMDEASGTRIDTPGDNDLSDNATVASAVGIIGNAASFLASNSEFLSKTDDADFGFTTAMSLSIWVYRDSVDVNRTIVGKWTYQTDGGFVLQSAEAASGAFTAGDLTMIIATSPTDDSTGCLMHFEDANQLASTWYHLVIVFDGSLSGDANRLKIYQNGVALTLTAVQGAVPASMIADTADFNFGKFGGSVTRYWNGRMDEGGLWNRALTSGEVSALYNSGSGKPCCPFTL